MRQSRNGTMLLQLMLTIGAASMLTLLCVSLIHRSFSFVSFYRKAETNNLQIRNLGNKLRQDLLIARSVRLLESENEIATGIELKQIDGSIVLYALSPQAIHRTHRLNSPTETDSNGNNTGEDIESVDARNTFPLAKNWEAKLEATETSAQLTIVRKLLPNDGPAETVLLRVASPILPLIRPSSDPNSRTGGSAR